MVDYGYSTSGAGARGIVGESGMYSQARFLLGLNKFFNYLMLIIGIALLAVGVVALFASAGDASLGPFSAAFAAFYLCPAGLLLVWLAIRGLASLQIQQATLDNAEASLLILLLMRDRARQDRQ